MGKVTHEDVVMAYKTYLGRKPESEKAFEGRVGKIDKEKLKQIVLKSKEHLDKASQSGVDFFVFGNCHALSYKNIIEAVTELKGASYDIGTYKKILSGEDFIAHKVTNAKLVILATEDGNKANDFLNLFSVPEKKVRHLPTFLIKSFHPDLVYVYKKSRELISSEYHYNSRVCLYSYLAGLDVEAAKDLYCEKLFQELGYFDFLEADRKEVASRSRKCQLPISEIFEEFLGKKRHFMHSINHPKIDLLKEVVFEFLTREGIRFDKTRANYISDPLERNMCFPVYPEIARKFGIDGGYYFKFPFTLQNKYKKTGCDLYEFIRIQYETFSQVERSEIALSNYDVLLFEKFKNYIKALGVASVHSNIRPKNPYKNLARFNFWRRSVSSLPLEEVDPVVKPKFVIGREDKVATAGSCFAQHISKTLSRSGFNYFVTETSDAPDAVTNNYGVYSARYGNIYSTRQLLQLFYRVYGYFSPVDDAWDAEELRLVDPFRPQIQVGGFTSVEELHESREQHFEAVRRMFEEMDIFIFTLGLTEIWRSKVDGAVFPLAPGVAGGAMDEAKYEFVNLGVEDVRKDLQVFLSMLSTVNPKAKVLLTVSPVSLMATYEDRHVLCSTTLSKSALRVAADIVSRENSNVDYFPSYEIITGSYTRGRFFEDDFRSVKPEGVSQVMKVFMKNFTSIGGQNVELVAEDNTKVSSDLIVQDYARNAAIVCEEELLAQ